MNEPQASSRRRYEILGTLGRGGFGTVYHARLLGEEGFVKHVALKMLHANLLDRPELVGRFRDEARILGLIRHRAVVQVDDLVRLDGAWTIVMEYVDGVDLHRILQSGPIPPRAAMEIVQEVASALDVALHTKGPDKRSLNLLHRDIKPGNLLLTAVGEVKVLDFGIARADFDEREGVTKSMGFGSPEYMSPERLEWENGPAADIYALGCVLYEILTRTRVGITTGHPDRHQARVQEVCAQVIKQLGPSTEGISELLRQMLTYEAAHRPSARDVEAQCATLIATMGGTRLRDWADKAVPEARAIQSRPQVGETPGRVVVESAWPTAPEGVGTVPGSSPLRWVAAGVLASVLLLVLGGGLVWLGLSQRIEPDLASTSAAGATPPAPSGDLNVPVEPPKDEPPQPPAVDPTSKEDSKPPEGPAGGDQAGGQKQGGGTRAHPPVTPPPSKEPDPAPAPEKVTVTLDSDVSPVRLKSKGGSSTYTLPGAVPVGDYNVEVSADGGPAVVWGTLNLAAGQKVLVRCKAGLKHCVSALQ